MTIQICGDVGMDIKTIDECFCQIRNGANIKQGISDGGYPITRIETIANDKFNRNRMGYAGITNLENYQSYVLEDGDLLMSHINSIQYLGRTVLYEKQGDERIIHGMNLLCLKANKDIILPSYARYFFCTRYFREQIRTITKKSVNQASFAVTDLKKLKILIFPIDEQRHIVDMLDRVKKVMVLRQQELQKLDDLVKARFVELFGDPVRNSMGLKTMPLGKACCLKAGITTSADMIHEQSNEFSIPCYGGNGIRGYVELATQCGCYPIIGRQGALCGNVQLATGKFHATEHAVLVTPLIETNVIWLFYLLKMMDLYRFHTGAAQPGLAVKTLNTVDIPIADVAAQHQFAAFVTQTDKSKVAVQKALDEAQLLFDSLMQKYFG